MDNQATLRIWVVGASNSGKSALIQGIYNGPSEGTDTYGCFAVKIYRCETNRCISKPNYVSTPGWAIDPGTPTCQRDGCGSQMILVKHISLIECQSQDIETILNHANPHDAALLVVPANTPCPQPELSRQTSILEIVGVRHFIIAQTQVGHLTPEEALDHYSTILRFAIDLPLKESPIAQVSADTSGNLDTGSLLAPIANIPEPVRDFSQPPQLLITHIPGLNTVALSKKGLVAGYLEQGILHVNQNIEIRPGHVIRNDQEIFGYTPINTRVVSIATVGKDLQVAIPGETIIVEIELDITTELRSLLLGQVLGRGLPAVYSSIRSIHFLLRNSPVINGQVVRARVQRIIENENIFVSVGPKKIRGRAIRVRSDRLQISVESPFCTELNRRFVLFRDSPEQSMHVIGYGIFKGGNEAELEEQ